MLNLLAKDFKLIFAKKDSVKKQVLSSIFSVLVIAILIAIETFIFQVLLNKIKNYPGIKETNHELNNTEESLINENEILGDLLKIELAMFKQEQKIAEVQNSESNKVESVETNNQEVKQKESQQIEKARK